MNTYLREFVQISIDDFVNFIKVFTAPKETDGELWRVSKEPFIVVHLSLQKKAKKKEAKKPVKGKEKKEEESTPEVKEETPKEEEKKEEVAKE